MGEFNTLLDWKVLKSGRRRLNEDLMYVLDPDQAEALGQDAVTAEAGFVTDGGSIPRLFWSFASPYTGKAVEGYVIHDWLCEHPELCNRSLANKIMKRAHKDRGVGSIKRNVIYSFVCAYAFVARKK